MAASKIFLTASHTKQLNFDFKLNYFRKPACTVIPMEYGLNFAAFGRTFFFVLFSNLGATKKIQNFIKPVIVMCVGILVEFASRMLSKVVCIFPPHNS